MWDNTQNGYLPKHIPQNMFHTHIDFNRDPQILDLTYGNNVFYNPYSGLKLLLPSKLQHLPFITYILFSSLVLYHTSSMPTAPTCTNNYLPSDDLYVMEPIVSDYDCEKQQNRRQFKLLNKKQCTEAPSNIQQANVQARVNVRAKAKRNKAFKCEAYAPKKSFQGIVKHRSVDRNVWNHNTMPILFFLTLSNAKPELDTLMVLTTKYWTT